MPSPPTRIPVLVALIAGLALALWPAGAPAATATLTAPAAIQADEELTWHFTLDVGNSAEMGFHLDSLWLEVHDLDPGNTRADRVTQVDVSRTLRLIGSIGAGDTTTIDHTMPAMSEHARITVRLIGHRLEAAPETLAAVIEAEPGPGFARYPTRFLSDRHVEWVFVPAPEDSGPRPGLLLVHGHASHARLMIPLARRIAAKGFAVALVSMPGYGQSQGPADFMGPATVAALEGVLDQLKRSPGVDARRLAAWGVSRGATAVALLAAKRADIKAVVLQSGIYDLWAVHRGTTLAGFPETIVAEAGPDSAAWRARSPSARVARGGAAVLIAHGEEDTRIPFAQAGAYAQALERKGVPVTRFFMARAGHTMPMNLVQPRVLQFLNAQFAR